MTLTSLLTFISAVSLGAALSLGALGLLRVRGTNFSEVTGFLVGLTGPLAAGLLAHLLAIERGLEYVGLAVAFGVPMAAGVVTIGLLVSADV